MVQLGSHPRHADAGQTDVIVSLCSLGLMLCMVVAVLGIKFRWFKQRLNFEPIPTGSGGSADNGQVVLTRNSRSSQEQIREPVLAQGVFRRKLDEDVIIERPRTLPPVRVRKASKGPLTFGPPKRSETPSSTVEEPVVSPPPPPPLPSASSLTLSSSGGSPKLFAKIRVKTPPADGKTVNFNSTTPIIPNGETNKTYEQLKTEEEQGNRQYTERRPTGYVRPSDEINAQLLNSDREPPQVQPRNITPDKPKEIFKKKAVPKATKTTIEPLKTEEDQNEGYKMGQRRLTGFFPPSDEDREDIEEFVESERKSPHKVVFLLDDEDDESKSPPTPPTPPTPPVSPPPPPILFSSQISTDDDRNSSDSWSAIQRHRNLAQEISEHHEAMQSRRRENAETSGPVPEFRNPLAVQQQQQKQQPKPRTMRDMKRNNAQNDLLLDSERHDTEA